MSVGYADVEVQGVSFAVSYGRVLGFIRPVGYVEGIAYNDPDSRYYRDTFSNGQSRCRDSATGRFASDASCTAAWKLAVRGEALVRMLRSPVLFGPGIRMGEGGTTPYGTAMYETPFGSQSSAVLQAKTNAGPKYLQAELGAALTF